MRKEQRQIARSRKGTGTEGKRGANRGGCCTHCRGPPGGVSHDMENMEERPRRAQNRRTSDRGGGRGVRKEQASPIQRKEEKTSRRVVKRNVTQRLHMFMRQTKKAALALHLSFFLRVVSTSRHTRCAYDALNSNAWQSKKKRRREDMQGKNRFGRFLEGMTG